MAQNPALADHPGPAGYEFTYGGRVGVDQVKVDAVLHLLRLGHLVEVQGGFAPLRIGSADRGEEPVAAFIERAAERR